MNRRAVGPLIAFLVVSTAASPLLAQVQIWSGLDPTLLRLTVFSTAVGGAVVWLIWRNRLAYPPTTKTGLVRPLLAAIAAMVLIACLLLGIARAEHAPWRPGGRTDMGAPLALFLLIQLAGAGAEEVGWRGLVQPLLESKLRPAFAALITGVLFGAGHFYLAFAVSPTAFTLFIVAATAISLILAWFTVGRSPLSRIVIATALHFLINMVTFGLFNDGDGSVLYFADMALVFGFFGALAFVGLLVTRPTKNAPTTGEAGRTDGD